MLFALLLLETALAAAQPSPAPGETISGPYTYRNLTVFLIHRTESVRPTKRVKMMTLQEALRRKKVVVYETGDVGELAIRNRSRDHSIYIQAGDIVKGGQQDRVIPRDMVVPPRSGKIPLPSFCVEQGRWEGRGSEAVTQFGSSDNQLASRKLKLAAKLQGEQGEVWKEVEASQAQLDKVLASNVRSEVSASSLQLTYENDSLNRSIDAYLEELSGIIDGKSDVTGFAFAINGEVNSVDVYRSNSLFRKLWPKLIRAAATEAIAESDVNAPVEAVTMGKIRETMIEAENAPEKVGNEGAREDDVTIVTRDAKDNVLFETRDGDGAGTWIHRSYMKK
jgi:hypothetical protein